MKKVLFMVLIIAFITVYQSEYSVKAMNEGNTTEDFMVSDINKDNKNKKIMDILWVEFKYLSLEEDTTTNSMRLKVLVKSTNEASMDLRIEDFSVNGFMYQEGNENHILVSEGMQDESSLCISKEFLEANRIKKIKSIEFKIVAYTVKSNRMFFSKQVKITTGSKDKYIQEIDDSGRTIFDDNDIKIVSKGFDPLKGADDLKNYIYIENNSNKKIYIDVVASPWVFTSENKFGFMIMPGKKLNTFLQFDPNAIAGEDHVHVGFIIHEINLGGKEINRIENVKIPMTATAAPETIEGCVIYEKEGVKVTASHLEGPTEAFRNKSLKLLIENNTASEILISTDGVYINGILAKKSELGTLRIKPGTTTESIPIYSEDIAQSGFEKIASIEFRIIIFKENNTTVSDDITIETSAKSEFVPTSGTTGETLYHSNGIKIVYQGQKNSASSGRSCDFYIENNTQDDIYMYIITESFMKDKYEKEPRTIQSGKGMNYSLKFDSNRKENLDIKFKFFTFVQTNSEGRKKKVIETDTIGLPIK